MNNSDYDPETRDHYYERYTNYSDQQIKEILKNHHDYQELAVTAAIKIAIEREIIHSDQDLMAPEYQTRANHQKTAFPEVSNAFQHNKIVRSIFRILFFVAAIPIIFGILKYAEGQLTMTYLGIGIGLIWLVLTFALLKTRKPAIIFIQIFFILPLSVFLALQLIKQEIFPVTDMLVLFILTALVVYFLLYLRKLFLTVPEKLPGQ
jgi:hypothetical protein